MTLCVDLRDCEKIKDQCNNVSMSSYDKKWLRNNCAYTCRLCSKQLLMILKFERENVTSYFKESMNRSLTLKLGGKFYDSVLHVKLSLTHFHSQE